MDRALKAATGLLLLGVGLGAVLRVGQVWPVPGVHVGNGTHAHSHTLYFGWAGLALFTLFFERLGETGRAARLTLGALALLGLATFPVFLAYGYGRPGVVLAAVSVLPFGAAVFRVTRAAWRAPGVDLVFLRVAVSFVVLSYVAALSRVAFKAVHLDSPFLAALSVHLFLGCFGAFFVLGVMGLTVRALGVSEPKPLRLVLGFAALLPWPSMLTVPEVDATPLGPFARLTAVLMLVPAAAWVRWVYLASRDRSAAQRAVLRSAAVAWALSVLALALFAVGLLESLAQQRHAVVLVLHLQTLSVVTTSLFALLELRRSTPRFGLVLGHQVAVGVLLAGLAVAALGWGLPGLRLAAAGGVLVVLVQVALVARTWRGPVQVARLVLDCTQHQ